MSPVLEALHRPATKAAGRRLTKTAPNANPRHAGQVLEGTYQLIQETLGRFEPGLLFQVLKLSMNLAPRKRADSIARHLAFGSFALPSTSTESLPDLFDHAWGNFDGVPGVDGLKQYLLKLLFGTALLVSTH
jgi:hypothetical protein